MDPVQGAVNFLGDKWPLRPPEPRYEPPMALLGRFYCTIHTSRRYRAKAMSPRPILQCLPRPTLLLRLLMATIAVLVFIQAISCGMFFCVVLPLSHRAYLDLGELQLMSNAVTLTVGVADPPMAGAMPGTAAMERSTTPLITPKLIPRVVHQTDRSRRLPSAVKPLMRSWATVNGESWQVG